MGVSFSPKCLEMTKQGAILIVPVLSGLILSVMAVAAADAQESPAKKSFEEAVKAKLPEYLKMRDAIVEHGEAMSLFLEERRKTPETWQEFLLVEILLERMGGAEEIEKLVREPIRCPSLPKEVGDWIPLAMALSKRFKEFPMVLAEFLWKGNELNNIKILPREEGNPEYPLKNKGLAGPAVAAALAKLQETRVQWLFLDILENGDDAATREAIAKGMLGNSLLGMVGTPEILDDLLRIAGSGGDELAVQGAAMSITSCLEGSALPKIKAVYEDPKYEELRALFAIILRNLDPDAKPYREPVAPLGAKFITQPGPTGPQLSVDASGRAKPEPSEPVPELRARISWCAFTVGLAVGLVVGVVTALAAMRIRRSHGGS